jgi:hypothetical protein
MAVSESPSNFDSLWADLGTTEDAYGPDDGVVEPHQKPRAPWYRTTAAMTAIGAIGLAVIAMVVSAVLLVSRNSQGPATEIRPTIAPTPPPSAPATPPPMVATVPPAPAETPSPTEVTVDAPVVVAPPPETRVKKPPEIGVTRTPMRVTPQPRQPHPSYPRN